MLDRLTVAAAVVFAFAVADGLPPVVGAAPYEVLARQIPRLLVTRLNAGADRGVRFFPFLGPIDGQRTFLRVRELFDPRALSMLHKQEDAAILCDGLIADGVLQIRILDARSVEVLLAADLPFSPLRPLDVLGRIEFELIGLLGRSGRPTPAIPLSGEALGWFLVLKDAVLRREANLADPSPDPLRPARRCLELAPGEPEVRELVIDFAAHLLRAGERRTEVAQLLEPLAALVDGPVHMLERLAALAIASGAEAIGADLAMRAARMAPERADLVERAAAQSFRLARFDEVRELVGLARRRGVASPGALAQLAAVCDRTGDLQGRAALVDELLGMPDLPVPVARLLVSFLLEDERPLPALQLLERALLAEPRQAMLHFEVGRACLLLDDGRRAEVALRTAIELGLPPAIALQARRFLRLAVVPGLWAGTQRVENALASGDVVGALAGVHAMVRHTGPIAEAWLLLGVVRHRSGQGRRAERALRRALRLDAECGDAHNRLGILLVSRGQLDEGHGHLQRAHELAPTDSGPLLHLAQASALLGRRAEAERHLIAAERCGADPDLVAAVRRGFLQPRD